MCRMLHKCIFGTLTRNSFSTRNFVQFMLEVDMQFFLTNQLDNGSKPTYLSVSKIVSPTFWLELQPVFSLILSLPLKRGYTSKHHFNNHEFDRTGKTPAVPSLPVARKQSNSNVFPVTPYPTKDCGSKQPSVDNEPSFNAWKTSHTTPPTKVTDDSFIDNRKPPSKSVPIGDKKIQ